MNISARERCKHLFDGGLFSEIEVKEPIVDPLNFKDTKKYTDRMKAAQKQTRSTVAVQMLKEAQLPYVVVLTNPTTGGVTASYAMLGDVQIAEPNALICFAGPRVIEQTIREKLPDGFQRSEYLLDHGMLDLVVERAKIRDTLITLLHLLMKKPAAVKGDLPSK